MSSGGPSTSATPGKVLATTSNGSFQRVTTKFWVPLDRLETVKARIAKNIPIYKFDKTLPVPAYTNSVYMDSSDFSCYYNRLRRVEDAFLIRLRWYQSDYNRIFVERKVHHESWGGEVSVKSRFTMHAADVPRFLSGEYELEEHVTHLGEFREQRDTVTELFNEFREKISTTRLFPLIRTKYARTAFQYTPHRDCRASLDEDLQMCMEPCEPGQFRRDENTPIREDQILRFPYAVFELKVENPEAFPDQWPDWVQEMVEDGSFIEVYKYSKFLTGVAWLFPERTTVNPAWLPLLTEKVKIIDPHTQRSKQAPKDAIMTTDILKSDYSLTDQGKNLVNPGAIVVVDMNKGKSKPAAIKNKSAADELRTPLLSDVGNNNDQNDAFRNNFNDAIARTTYPPFPAGIFEGKPMLVPMKVEPKVFFANERTMIHWVKFGTTIGVAGAVLAQFGGNREKYSGLALVIFGISMMIYALTIFRLRAAKIRNRERGPYDDPVGPVFLVIGFVFMLTIRLAMEIVNDPNNLLPPCRPL